MGLTDFFYEASDATLWLIGLGVATIVFLGMGASGVGVGASFQAWGAFLDVFKAVIGIQVVFGILALLISLLPLILIAILGYVGVKLFNNLIGPVSLSESAAQLMGGTSLQSIIVFVLIVLLLL